MSLSNELSQLRQIRRTAAQGTDDGIIHTAISANVAGDNILIVPPGPRFSIFELFLWNGSQTQTLILKDGADDRLPRPVRNLFRLRREQRASLQSVCR
jgi:hypothetical protein